jgi:tetratricopeptide (TPR) repeat protein
MNDNAAALAALDKAESLAARRRSRRRRISLRSQQLDAIVDLGNLDKLKTYRKALDEALVLDPNDAELWLMRGNAEEPSAAGRGQRGGRESITFYERALTVSPNNFAAHHYLIHSCENIGDMECALRHGKEYAQQAFAIPHARHMYGHDLRRVGRIEEAIAEFTRADELERSYYDAEKISADYDWHHQHNLDLLSTSYQYQGRLTMADKLMREAFAIPSVDDGREFAKKEWPRFLLGRGRLNEALVAAKTLANGKYPAARTMGHVIAGQVLLEMNRTAEAGQELTAAEKQLQDLPRVASGVSTSQAMVEPELQALRAEILLRAGKPQQGGAMFREVERGLRALLGPDAWSQALFRLESIAHLARSLGDWELARHTAQQMLEHDPAYAGSHYALALVAEHDGDSATAQKEFALAVRYWQKADADLAELKVSKSKIVSRVN